MIDREGIRAAFRQGVVKALLSGLPQERADLYKPLFEDALHTYRTTALAAVIRRVVGCLSSPLPTSMVWKTATEVFYRRYRFQNHLDMDDDAQLCASIAAEVVSLLEATSTVVITKGRL